MREANGMKDAGIADLAAQMYVANLRTLSQLAQHLTRSPPSSGDTVTAMVVAIETVTDDAIVR